MIINTQIQIGQNILKIIIDSITDKNTHQPETLHSLLNNLAQSYHIRQKYNQSKTLSIPNYTDTVKKTRVKLLTYKLFTLSCRILTTSQIECKRISVVERKRILTHHLSYRPIRVKLRLRMLSKHYNYVYLCVSAEII